MIKVRITKAIRETRKAPTLSALARASWLAQAYAEHVLVRVAKRGEVYRDMGSRHRFSFASPPDDGRPYFVSKGYSKDATGRPVVRWASSRSFHAAAKSKPGTFNVTGGMWKGLTVSGSKGSAHIFFGASSVGAGSKKQLVTKTRRRGGKVVSQKQVMKYDKVRNRVKARKILQHSDINVLGMPRWERETMGFAIAGALRIQFQTALGTRFSRLRRRSRYQELYRRVSRRMRGVI